MAIYAFSMKDTTKHILGQWKSNGNGSASHQRWRNHIVKAVGCSVIHRQCKKSGPVVCRATRRTSEWRSNHTRKPTWCEHRIRAMEGWLTHWSRPRTGNRDRSDLLEEVFAPDNTHYHDTRYDEPGIGTTRRISFTLFGTLVIFGRPHYWFVTG